MIPSHEVAALIIVALISIGIAFAVSRTAARLGLVDVPNARSSHARPTPRGGGLGIVVAVIAGIAYATTVATIPVNPWLLLVGATLVAGVGLFDDVRSTSPFLRLCAHSIAALLIVLAFPNSDRIQILDGLTLSGVSTILICCVGVISSINVFNFMDGIDGLAASEAAFAAGGAYLVLSLGGHQDASVVFICAIVFAGCMGFLVLNLPPARIFLGDIGSGFLGLVVSGIAVWTLAERLTSIWVWLILGGLFITDSSVTVVRRLARGENIASPHRMHAYQRLARRWASHGRVTATAVAVNCLWLLPLSIAASLRPQLAPIFTGAALIPLWIAVWLLGAGLPERRA